MNRYETHVQRSVTDYLFCPLNDVFVYLLLKPNMLSEKDTTSWSTGS